MAHVRRVSRACAASSRRALRSYPAIGLALIALVLLAGTVASHLFAGERWWPAFYRSFLIASSGEPAAADALPEQLINIGLVVFGVAAYLWGFSLVARAFAGRLLASGARRERRRIVKLAGHQILCGFGRVGKTAAAELAIAGVPFVLVESGAKQILLAREQGLLVVEGDATDAAVLRRAGIANAAGLIATLDTDAQNLYVVLIAHELKPELLIAARATGEPAAAKLRAAGADRIVSPYESAGKKLAAFAANPQLENWVDLSSYVGGDLRLVQLDVDRGSWAAGKTLSELEAVSQAKTVALRPSGSATEIELTLAGARVLSPRDVVIALGTAEAVAELERLIST